MLPNFVIVGAQKSASTFIQACLSEHPNIYLPEGETPFFESPDYENSSIQTLESEFDGRSEQYLGIKRPTYIGRSEVADRIHQHLPNAKLIAVLRNPIDRAVSSYFHNVKYGFIPPLDVETGIRKVLFSPEYQETYKRSSEIIECGYYSKYLNQYRHYFDNEQFLVLLHDDIKQNSLNSIQTTYRFLGVSDDFRPEALTSRPQKVLYNIQRLKLISLRNNFMYTYNDELTRLVTKNKNPVDVFVAGTLTLIDRGFLALFMDNKKPTISAELKTLLYEKYKADIDELETLLGRNLEMWRPY